jgi:hypothetical protein
MKKKVLVIPMKQQYEQHCNAAGAADLGIPVIKSLKKKHIHKVETWLNNQQRIEVDFKDDTNSIIDLVLQKAMPGIQTREVKSTIFNNEILIANA